ncbi:hypothetical protein Ae201684P_007286 [Aphanomyces euteiches]|uniref:F-box domain-containing protein n=1 Tax=Aphanomyces euteiches TaxID=100861 RepID=A0A6G0WV91_9STRA|nr:hypothetical protein Ae201684_011284 [Aphanomyces euteiches]KAH9101098.1 hypothetical protein Ae201684P_007286 [Aphanomyces euteiches]KAH9139404.1 hypothetical protein AeRB84_016324 [Aphanomyces euteiches]
MPPNLPLEVIVHVAFFIQEWSTLIQYIEALRSATVADLGPLEHMWELHLQGCENKDLWPRLDLTNTADVSRIHVEAIAKYYGSLSLSAATEISWVSQFVDPKASLQLIMPSKLGTSTLNVLHQWSQCRITSLHFSGPHDSFCEHLSSFRQLQVLQMDRCTQSNAAIVFKFAASSLSLLELQVQTFQRRWYVNCVMKTSMANDIFTWIGSLPVRRIELMGFSWESLTLRREFLAVVNEKPTLESFKLFDSDKTTFVLRTRYDRQSNMLSLAVSSLEIRGFAAMDMTTLTDYVYQLREILQTNAKTLQLVFLTWQQCRILYNMFVPFLQESSLGKLDIKLYKMTVDNAAQLAHDLFEHPHFHDLNISTVNIPTAAVKTLLTALSTWLSKIDLGRIEIVYSKEESNELKEFALKQGVQVEFEFTWNKLVQLKT